MKTKQRHMSWVFVSATLACGGLWSQAARAQQQLLTMTIDAGKTGAPINRYLYGQFSELLGNMYEKGLWAEMLSDRKFFYPVDSSQTLAPPNSKRNFNRWRPVGPDGAITMDAQHPFVGKQAPSITLAGSTPRGITQTGLILRKGKDYTGRIVLAGTTGAKVQISLIWGDAPDQRQTVTIPALATDYARFPLRLHRRR